jgi:hypothetical protein
MGFHPLKEEIYYYNFINSIKRNKEMEVAKTMVVTTVEQIQWNFTKRE